MYLNVLKTCRSAQNNFSPSCNITLLLPMKAAQSFGSLCVLDLLESVPGLVHSRVACPCLAATPHVLLPPWQGKENSSGGLRLQTLPTVISDRVAEFLQPVGPS